MYVNWYIFKGLRPPAAGTLFLGYVATVACFVCILRGFRCFEVAKARNLRGFVAWNLEKHRFGCILGTENAAKPWFWRLGGSKAMYSTIV